MRRGSALGLLLLAACASGGPPPPAALDTANETCRSCRMAVSDPGFAAQIVAPGEEPRFFDDVGCLRDFFASARELPAGATAYVADHRTRVWVAAAAAVYTRVPGLETPMGSHLIAHADAASRDRDPLAKGEAVAARAILGTLAGGGAAP
jgi:copper chaperone NosL